MVQYLQYGLTKIDSISSSTMASSYLLDTNDTSENYKYVIVVGSIQYDADVTGVVRWGLRRGTDYQSARYRLLQSGTTSTSASNSSSVMKMM